MVLLLLPMLKDRGFTPLLTLENSLTSLPSLLQVSQRKSFRQLQGKVVPNGNSTDANEQLQLVFKLSNLAAKAGSSVNFGTGDQFITVRGFKDGSGNIVELEKGKIYTISKADFTFDESNLSTIPNTSAVSVWLKVTVKAWTVVPVKPNL